MDLALIILLIIIANGSPIIARLLLGKRLGTAIDGGMIFLDGRPLLGCSKTWRGLIASLLTTVIAAELIVDDYYVGLLIASGAMLGDLCSSFIKRRMGIEVSGMGFMLDQVPESLIPALLLIQIYSLSWLDVTLIVIIFAFIELLLSRVLFTLGIRNRPY